MAVFALWSAPRARSTAFFRSMAERGDMTVLHEPFCNLRDYGETDAGARTFDSPLSLLAWLRDETHNMSVFLKETPPSGEHFRDVFAADPARVDGRFAERDAGAGWSDKVSDHDAQNQTGARDRDQSD